MNNMNTCIFRIGISGSGSSDEHKNGNESMYVGDLSDSAMASPYEKPVSFKSEVALFSPRSSDGYGEIIVLLSDASIFEDCKNSYESSIADTSCDFRQLPL